MNSIGHRAEINYKALIMHYVAKLRVNVLRIGMCPVVRMHVHVNA